MYFKINSNNHELDWRKKQNSSEKVDQRIQQFTVTQSFDLGMLLNFLLIEEKEV